DRVARYGDGADRLAGCRPLTLRSAAELEPDIGRGSHRFQAPERLDARVAVPRRGLMRVVHAVQADLIRTALVVTEFQCLAIRELRTVTVFERTRVAVEAADRQRLTVEIHPASGPMNLNSGGAWRRVLELHQAHQLVGVARHRRARRFARRGGERYVVAQVCRGAVAGGRVNAGGIGR